MTPDEMLAERMRPLLARRKGFAEKQMFGGTCFMVRGRMCVGTLKGSLVVRLDRKRHDAIQAEPHTKPFDSTGRIFKGWAIVEPAGIESDEDLKAWVLRAVKFAASLPAK